METPGVPPGLAQLLGAAITLVISGIVPVLLVILK
jgi:hypothetical protein